MVKIKSKKRGKFKCKICKVICTFKYSLKKHMDEVHLNPEPSFECEICGKLLKRQESKFRHMAAVHLKELPEICPYDNCGARFGWRNEIKSHIQAYHTEKDERDKFPCKKCSKVYLSNQGLQQHIKKDHLGTGVKCMIENCGYSANNKNHLKIHLQTHSGDQPFGCLKCDRKFNNNSNLNRHVRTVHDPNAPKFPCPTCFKEIKTANDLKIHIKTVHDPNSRIFTCPNCSKKFYSRKSLKNHLETHKDKELREKLKCEHCPKEFLTKENLLAHVQINHTKSGEFICTFDECGKSFAVKLYLTRHIRLQHQNKRYKCYFCGCTFVEPRGRDGHMLSKHLMERPFSCQITNCRRSFATLSPLREHVKYAHNINKIQIVCPIRGCKSSFSRKEAIKRHVEFVHNKSSRYQCSLCGQKYRDSQALGDHIRREHTKETPFHCQICEWKGTSSGKLLKHCKDFHGV